MLSKIGDFIVKLFIFGVGYYAINISIDVLNAFLIYEHSLKVVAMALWTFIPGLYLIKRAISLYHDAQEAR